MNKSQNKKRLLHALGKMARYADASADVRVFATDAAKGEYTILLEQKVKLSTDGEKQDVLMGFCTWVERGEPLDSEDSA